jgi:threonine dehydrogenase-like Zn-dependent dehydrogenase
MAPAGLNSMSRPVAHERASRRRESKAKGLAAMKGKIEIDPMIAHVLPIADINTAFDLMQAVRSVVVF